MTDLLRKTLLLVEYIGCLTLVEMEHGLPVESRQGDGR